jgi:xanthine dehydrogenase small subunit
MWWALREPSGNPYAAYLAKPIHRIKRLLRWRAALLAGKEEDASPFAAHRATLRGMSEDPSFYLNGQRVALDGSAPTQSLLRWLNARALHGSKEGCGDGDCGACTVVLLETDAAGESRWQAVNSCLLPVGYLPGRQVLTVEGLGQGQVLHPVQRAMVDCAGSQCGYCTPGFVMSLFAGQQNGELGDACIEGNLCRCTGYQPIRSAMQVLREHSTPSDEWRVESQTLGAARLAQFFSPLALAEALALKAQHPEAAWIAGATDLGVDMSRGKPVAEVFIALDRIAELQVLEIGAESVRIGAAVSLSRIESELQGLFPALDQMLHWFAARQVRNRATVGGNLGSASPIGDLLPVLLALEARIELAGPQGWRWVETEEFFLDYRKTARAPDELIVAVEIPRRADLHNASLKLAKRPSDDISTVAASFALQRDADGTVRYVRLAYGGVAAIPKRAHAVEAFLLGRVLDPATVDAASAMLEAAFQPLDDHRASAAYRRALCGSLFAKFVAELPA